MTSSVKGPFTPPTEEVLSKASSSLPPDFVDHLRAVFDKLDIQGNGYIRISDLECYWKSHYNLDSSVSNSPIIKRLNEIAPCDMGLVSFPRLCTGVKEALLGSRRSYKQRKVSFLNALSTDTVIEEPGTGSRRGSRDLIGGSNCRGGGRGGDGVLDENNNVNVYGFSPPSSPRSARQNRSSSGGGVKLGLGGIKFTTNKMVNNHKNHSHHNNNHNNQNNYNNLNNSYNNNNNYSSNHNINNNSHNNHSHSNTNHNNHDQDSTHNGNNHHSYRARQIAPHNEESHQLLNTGLRSLSQLKTWYTCRNTDLYNGELALLPEEELEKVRCMNNILHNIVAQQHQGNCLEDQLSTLTLTQNSTPSNQQENDEQAEEVRNLKERVTTLEGEKSVLIRELFQLKAQMKSPNNKLRVASV